MRLFIGKPLWRLATGITIGGLVGLGAIGSSVGALVPALPSVSSTLATGCTPWPAPIWRFTGQDQGVSNAGAIQGNITINQPVYVCDFGNAYWVMLFGPTGTKSGCTEGTQTYAQGGWLVGGDYVPHHYYEIALKKSCDPGPILTQSATYGTHHTYEVWLNNQFQSPTVDFYLDNTYETGAVLDWSWPDTTGLLVSAETQKQENRVGGESFTSLEYCTVPGGSNNCNPNTSMSSSCSNSQGCLSPRNPYGCYLSTGGNSFNVYDSRGNGGHC